MPVFCACRRAAIVMACAQLTGRRGEKVVPPVPVMIPFSAARLTPEAYQLPPGTSAKTAAPAAAANETIIPNASSSAQSFRFIVQIPPFFLFFQYYYSKYFPHTQAQKAPHAEKRRSLRERLFGIGHSAEIR